MKTALRCIAVFLLVSCSVLLAGQSTSSLPSSAPSKGANVLDLSGSVVIHDSAGKQLKAKRGAVLADGSLVETGVKSQILLRLPDGSEVLLGERSRLLLKAEPEQAGTSLFQLFVGRIRAVVTKRLNAAPSFQLGTPTAIIAVRGTQFNVVVNAHEVTQVDVEEGLVQVLSRRDASNAVLVKPGFSTRVGPDMIPEAPFATDLIRPDPREQRKESHDAPNPIDGHPSAPSPQPQQAQEGSDNPNFSQ